MKQPATTPRKIFKTFPFWERLEIRRAYDKQQRAAGRKDTLEHWLNQMPVDLNSISKIGGRSWLLSNLLIWDATKKGYDYWSDKAYNYTLKDILKLNPDGSKIKN